MILSVNHIEYDMELTNAKREKKMLVFHVFVIIGKLGGKGLWRKMPEEAIFVAFKCIIRSDFSFYNTSGKFFHRLKIKSVTLLCPLPVNKSTDDL